MSSRRSRPSAVQSDANRICRNDNSLRYVEIDDWDDAIEILDALKKNTVVQEVFIERLYSLHANQEARVQLSEVMKCNKSVQSFIICLQGGLLQGRIQLFASMAKSGGWSSIKELVLYDDIDYQEPLALSRREAEHVSSFILQSENLRTLRLEMAGDEAARIVEKLACTKVQNLKIYFRSPSSLHNEIRRLGRIKMHFRSPFSIQNGGRRLATALERCTGITKLRLKFPSHDDQVEIFQILLVESIPKMLGLKKLELEIYGSFDQQFFDMVGQCIGGHQGAIEELKLKCYSSAVHMSIVGLAPALKRLKVIQFDSGLLLSASQIGELSGIAADCGNLEEFGYNLPLPLDGTSTDDFKAICQLLSKFPSLKRVTQNCYGVDLRKEGRFTAFLEMVKTSKTIEQVPSCSGRNAKEKAAIQQHCHDNIVHNQIERIRKKGLLAATVPSSAWPLILKEFSGMPDVLYYLLQQKHGAMIGPCTRHGCKRKHGTLTK
jgi:hypothetical protein